MNKVERTQLLVLIISVLWIIGYAATGNEAMLINSSIFVALNLLIIAIKESEDSK